MMQDNQDVVDLRKRVEVLERYVALAMQSSNADWRPGLGLFFRSPNTNSEVIDMIIGHIKWDPKTLDKA